MKIKLKCPECGKRNRIQVEKVLLNPEGPKPKIQVFFSSYLPLKTEKCRKCGEVIAQEKTPIRITKIEKVLALIVILSSGFSFASFIIIMIQGSWMSICLWLITACIASILVSFSHSNFKPKLSKKILVCVLIAFVFVIPAYVT